jgi:hypothetical protein
MTPRTPADLAVQDDNLARLAELLDERPRPATSYVIENRAERRARQRREHRA